MGKKISGSNASLDLEIWKLGDDLWNFCFLLIFLLDQLDNLRREDRVGIGHVGRQIT